MGQGVELAEDVGQFVGEQPIERSARTGDVINSFDVPDVDGTKVFHAGTRLEGEHMVTAGGRVLCVCARGDPVAGAKHRAYEEVGGIPGHGEFHRHDIGWRAIGREQG